MSDRTQDERHDTYVPPTPQDVKPKGSHDNAVEMAAGGKAERRALAEREERLTAGNPQPPQPTPRDAATQTPAEQTTATERVGRTDSTQGTGVGYAGEGAASYGTQGAVGSPDTLADAPETTGREQHMHTGDTARTTDTEHAQRHDQTQQQEEIRHMEQEKQSKGTTPQSTGSGTTAHGKGETVSGEGVIGGSKTESATNAAAETLDAAKGHVEPAATSVTTHAQGAASDVKGHAEAAATGVKAHAQGAVSDVRDHAAQAASEVKDTAQSALADAQSEAQDRLQSVKANLQTKTDQLKGTVTDKTDQLKGTLTGIPDQVKGSVGERGEQAKQAANQTATQAGEKLTGLATTLREKTQTLEPESPVASVATKAVGALEQTGSYLQESTPDDWVSDLKSLIARKPLESVLVAAGIGYLFARAFRGGHHHE